MVKNALEIRLSLLDEGQFERMVFVEPEKFGIKEELIEMSDCWGDSLKVEKVSDCEFTVSFPIDTPSHGVVDMSSVVTFKYRFDECDIIDVSGFKEYPEFEGIEEFLGYTTESEGIEEEDKTYLVWQDNYTTGYGVYDPTDEDGHKPSEFDIAESFTAEEGAKWFGYLNETIHVQKDDMEEAGYTVEDLENMSKTELYDAVYDILPDPEKEFSDWENGALIIECDEDKPNEAYDIEDNDDWDEFVVTVDVKYKFTMGEGEVEFERVK